MASLLRVKDSADRALDLEPLLLEAYLALGQYYYWGYLNYESALEELVIVESRPGDHSRILEIVSYIQKRTIRIIGSTAIPSGVYVNPRRDGTSSRSRYTDTWMHLDGRWQVV